MTATIITACFLTTMNCTLVLWKLDHWQKGNTHMYWRLESIGYYFLLKNCPCCIIYKIYLLFSHIDELCSRQGLLWKLSRDLKICRQFWFICFPSSQYFFSVMNINCLVTHRNSIKRIQSNETFVPFEVKPLSVTVIGDSLRTCSVCVLRKTADDSSTRFPGKLKTQIKLSRGLRRLFAGDQLGLL